MLFKFNRFEVFVGKCITDVHFLPKLCKGKVDIFFSWLGGCIVWSRLKRTSKDTDRV